MQHTKSASELPMITDHGGCRKTCLPVRKINLKIPEETVKQIGANKP